MSWRIDIELNNADLKEYNLSEHFDFKSILFLEDNLRIISDRKTLNKGEDYIVQNANSEVKIVFLKPINERITIFFKTRT